MIAKEGKVPKWKHEVDFREFLGEGEEQEDMLRAAAGIRSRMPKHLLERASYELGQLDKAAAAGELVWFNAELNKLWDFLDDAGVWVKF